MLRDIYTKAVSRISTIKTNVNNRANNLRN